MLRKLFKKAANTMKAERYTAKEIQEEVFAQQELLLAEAEKIINKHSHDRTEAEARFNRTKQLINIGFSNFDEAKEMKSIQEQISKEHKLKEEMKDRRILINDYALVYPGHKFITEDAITRVCEKYGLLFGSVKWYIGEIPEKNQKQLLQFKVRRKDVQNVSGVSDWFGTSGVSGTSGPISRSNEIRELNSLIVQSRGIMIDAQEMVRSGDLLMSAQLLNQALHERERMLRERERISMMFPEAYAEVFMQKSKESEFIAPTGLKIIAPKEKFDLDKSGLRNMVQNHVIVDDPIVLQPVNGGYLVITAWGDEASDPDVVNQKMN